jgi:hypothetical protein
MFIVYPSRKQESCDEARVALTLNNHHGRLRTSLRFAHPKRQNATRPKKQKRRDWLSDSNNSDGRILTKFGTDIYAKGRGLGIFLFTTASITVLGPTQLPIQWVTGALTLGVKRPGREADHSPPSIAEVIQ